jgi:hypothetical protein
MDKPTSFIWIIIFFGGAFEYGGISKLSGYVLTKAKLLCAEFCNFLQCHIYKLFISLLFYQRWFKY